MKPETFHDTLKKIMDEYAHLIYAITKKFPKDEQYGMVSQLRRAALSVVLNYIEGYARGRDKVHKNFLEISYGSLKESKYLLHFALVEGFVAETDYQKATALAERIGAMVWGMLRKF